MYPHGTAFRVASIQKSLYFPVRDPVEILSAQRDLRLSRLWTRCALEVLLPTPASRSISHRNPSASQFCFTLLFIFICTFGGLSVHAQVTAVSLQSPSLAAGETAALTSPIHVEATAEASSAITGYVVYVDSENVYRNFSPTLDAWIALPPGSHALFVKAWDSNSDLATATYQINITGSAPPSPPAYASQILNISQGVWTVDNNPSVGGDCNDGSLGALARRSDLITNNLPAFAASENSTSAIRTEAAFRVVPRPRYGGFAPLVSGQLFVVNSHCTYDDSLFYWKTDTDPSAIAGATNFLWEFSFYVPATTETTTVQALESDLFQAVELSDGVHEFMFGSQCNYATNQWQFWLPQNDSLTWVDAGLSPCRFSTGAWHHATYFLQRVTPTGYQEIPASFSPSADTNTSVRFGTLTIDGETAYLGGLASSTIPNPAWSPVLGVQHQLDSAASGVTIEEYVIGESLTYW